MRHRASRRRLVTVAGTALAGGVTLGSTAAGETAVGSSPDLDIDRDFEAVGRTVGGANGASVWATVFRPARHTDLDRSRVRVARIVVEPDTSHDAVDLEITGVGSTAVSDASDGGLAIGPPRVLDGGQYGVEFGAGSDYGVDRSVRIDSARRGSTAGDIERRHLTEPGEDRFHVRYEFDADPRPTAVEGTAVFDTTDTDEFARAITFEWAVETPERVTSDSTTYSHVEGLLS